jgi:hypothetical protein
LSDTLNYGVNKFFMHLDSNHLITEKNFKSQISKITNLSSVIFFLLAQIPLSRISSAFAFLTCFIVWFMDHKTKKWVYDICQCCSRLEILKLHEIVWMEFDFTEEEYPKTKQQKEDYRTVVDWFVLHLVAFASFGLNYLYHISFQ